MQREDTVLAQRVIYEARLTGRMRSSILPCALCFAAPAAAQTFTGPPPSSMATHWTCRAREFGCFGIDAPELMQTCQRGGEEWRCGQDARALLAEIVATRTLSCAARDRDHYGRIVAICRASETDLSAFMAREGFAIALPQFTSAYLDLEARAKKFRLALWGSTFLMPANFRHANPALFVPPAKARANAWPDHFVAARGSGNQLVLSKLRTGARGRRRPALSRSAGLRRAHGWRRRRDRLRTLSTLTPRQRATFARKSPRNCSRGLAYSDPEIRRRIRL